MPLPSASKVWANYLAGWKSGEAYVDPLAAYLIYDTLTDADGTHVPDHVPEKAPGAWLGPDSAITSNVAVYGSVGISNYILSGAANIDTTWITDDTGLSPSQPGVAFRISDNGATFIYTRIIAGSLMFLDKNDMTNILTVSCTYTNPATWRVVTNGNALQVYYNGDLMFDTTNTYAVGGTGVGFWSWAGTQGCTTLSVVAA